MCSCRRWSCRTSHDSGRFVPSQRPAHQNPVRGEVAKGAQDAEDASKDAGHAKNVHLWRSDLHDATVHSGGCAQQSAGTRQNISEDSLQRSDPLHHWRVRLRRQRGVGAAAKILSRRSKNLFAHTGEARQHRWCSRSLQRCECLGTTNCQLPAQKTTSQASKAFTSMQDCAHYQACLSTAVEIAHLPLSYKFRKFPLVPFAGEQRLDALLARPLFHLHRKSGEFPSEVRHSHPSACKPAWSAEALDSSQQPRSCRLLSP